MSIAIDDVDYTRVLFGPHAQRAPMWMYVQDQGDGAVSFVGASHLPGQLHPWRFGSNRTHQLVVGGIIIRPRLVVATDIMRGHGLAGLATNDHDIAAMLDDGEILLGDTAPRREQDTIR